MTQEQVKVLRAGSRLRWQKDGTLGTVTETSVHEIHVRWDDEPNVIRVLAVTNWSVWDVIEPMGIRVPT